MVEAYKKYWKNGLDFKSKTNRADFWWAVLAIFLVSLALSIVINILGIGPKFGANFIPKITWGIGTVISSLWSLINFIPGLALSVRRLNDVNKPWWLLLLLLIPVVDFVVAIILLVFFVSPSANGNN